MDVPEIIFTCLAICLLLFCLVCAFFACLYSSTRRKQGNKIRNAPPETRVTVIEEEPKVTVVPAPVIIQEEKAIKRPRNLRIETAPVMTARSAIAIETDHAIDHFLAEMSAPTEQRRRLLDEEFQVLCSTEARRTTKTADKATRYRYLNRYADIVPYDHTLVELDGEHRKYINASYVQGEHDGLRFIATQGPIGEEEGMSVTTCGDFWRMIWQQNVECVVMLTGLQENHMQKCGRYWPKLVGTSEQFDEFRILLISENEQGKDVIHREIDMIDTHDRRRQISQYQYMNWMDNDAPNINTFLQFLMNIRRQKFQSPIVVHCSAGIGRTGVYICTDNVISRIKTEHIIDIFSEVNRARQQRPSMVNTLSQYISIYDTIALYVRNI